jgi:hypothetical protein
MALSAPDRFRQAASRSRKAGASVVMRAPPRPAADEESPRGVREYRPRWSVEDLISGARLHDLATSHDDDPIAESADHTEIVADEYHSELPLSP